MALPHAHTADDLDVDAPADDRWPWMADALCRAADPDLWFPSNGQTPDQAVEVCSRCPVRTRCLDYALAEGIGYGVYGGLTPAARRKLA